MRLILSACIILFMISGCGMVSAPETAYKQLMEYSYKKDWGAVYDNIDSYSKGQFDVSMRMMVAFASAFANDAARKEVDALSGREIFIRVAGSDMGADATSFAPKPNYKIIKTERKGKKAILTVKNGDGSLEEVPMVLEDNKWKMQLTGNEQKNTATTDNKKLTLTEKLEKTKQDRLAKEAREKEEIEKSRLRQFVTVALIDKSFLESDPMNGRYQDSIMIKLALENNSDKNIKAIKGVLLFNDVFGDRIHSSGFKYDEGIKAHSKEIWNGTLDYNQFMDDHKKLRSTELKNISLAWEPLTILFEDGTKEGE